MITTKEIIEIMKESPLFELLNGREKYEAITHAIEAAGIEYMGDEIEIRDIVGEVFATN